MIAACTSEPLHTRGTATEDTTHAKDEALKGLSGPAIIALRHKLLTPILADNSKLSHLREFKVAIHESIPPEVQHGTGGEIAQPDSVLPTKMMLALLNGGRIKLCRHEFLKTAHALGVELPAIGEVEIWMDADRKVRVALTQYESGKTSVEPRAKVEIQLNTPDTDEKILKMVGNIIAKTLDIEWMEKAPLGKSIFTQSLLKAGKLIVSNNTRLDGIDMTDIPAERIRVERAGDVESRLARILEHRTSTKLLQMQVRALECQIRERVEERTTLEDGTRGFRGFLRRATPEFARKTILSAWDSLTGVTVEERDARLAQLKGNGSELGIIDRLNVERGTVLERLREEKLSLEQLQKRSVGTPDDSILSSVTGYRNFIRSLSAVICETCEGARFRLPDSSQPAYRGAFARALRETSLPADRADGIVDASQALASLQKDLSIKLKPGQSLTALPDGTVQLKRARTGGDELISISEAGHGRLKVAITGVDGKTQSVSIYTDRLDGLMNAFIANKNIIIKHEPRPAGGEVVVVKKLSGSVRS